MRWLQQIPKIPSALARIRSVVEKGGPKRIRLAGVERPSGLLFPTARLRLEVEARTGAKLRWEPEVPIPFPYAWAYRLSDRLGVPVISSHDPEDLDLSVPVPRP